jgi:hypothetical protein
MATNLVALNVYQINQKPVSNGSSASQRIAFPTQGLIVRDTSGSETRSLSTGYNVYSALELPNGAQFYVTETVAQIVSAFNA